MTHSQNRPERRRDLRISPKGTVIVRADTYTLRGRLANLSRNGLAASTRTTAPERLLGAAVELELRLDGRDSGWLELGGKIIRIGAGSIAIALSKVPVSFPQILDESVNRSHHKARMLSIVLVDATTDRRHAIAEGFRAVGCVVVEVSTPLEAIVRLGESHFEPDLVAIADSLPASISAELRRFVETDHPDAWLVTIGDERTVPDGLLHWLSSTNPDDDLAARIRKLLTTFRTEGDR